MKTYDEVRAMFETLFGLIQEELEFMDVHTSSANSPFSTNAGTGAGGSIEGGHTDER